MAKGDSKEDKKKRQADVVDLASRIGVGSDTPAKLPPQREKAPPPPAPEPPESPRERHDAAIPSAPKPRLVAAKPDREQGALIRKALVEESEKPQPAIPSPRGAP